MIKNHLSKLLGERRMSQKQLAELTGIRPATINDMYHELSVYYSIDNIDKICEVLDCEVYELLERVPNKVRRTGENLIKEEYGNNKP